MCVQLTRDINSVVTTWQSQPISKFSRHCNEFMSVWSMFPCNTLTLGKFEKNIHTDVSSSKNSQFAMSTEIKVSSWFTG